jgi:hypothetical protein
MENKLFATVQPGSAQAAAAEPSSELGLLTGAIADVRILSGARNPSLLVRRGLLAEKATCEVARNDAASELRKTRLNSDERPDLYRRIQACTEQEHRIEDVLQTRLLPQHGPTQFVGPRAFLRTPLFRVAGKQRARQEATSLLLVAQPQVAYRGPELRQSDGLVFAALLHMARDVTLQTGVSFHAEDVCRVLFGRYDGNTRRQLRDHIQRLQSAVIAFDTFSIQLCLRFDYPNRGRWSITLDPNILALFGGDTQVWLDVSTRIQLPEGLTTWLYGYVRSQSKLIPMQLDALQQQCGSEASPKAFMNVMRLALRQLADRDVLAPGWWLGAGKVHWLKGPKG